MALYTELPAFRGSYQLLIMVFDVVKRIPWKNFSCGNKAGGRNATDTYSIYRIALEALINHVGMVCFCFFLQG